MFLYIKDEHSEKEIKKTNVIYNNIIMHHQKDKTFAR
jgi:hypothetical protein